MSDLETPTAQSAAVLGGNVKQVPWASVAAEAFKKLSPRVQIKNPVMFVVFLGSIVTTLLFIQAVTGKGEASAPFIFAIAARLIIPRLFSNNGQCRLITSALA